MNVTVDAERRIVISQGWGTVRDDDLRAGRRRLLSDASFDPTFDRIWDLSGVAEMQLSDEVLRQFASHSLSNSNVQRAIVCVAPQVVQRALDFVSACQRRHQPVSIFPTSAQATEWIEQTARP